MSCVNIIPKVLILVFHSSVNSSSSNLNNLIFKLVFEAFNRSNSVIHISVFSVESH